MDAGAIIAQEPVNIELGDTEESLIERVKIAEHSAYPQALELLASGRIARSKDGKVVWKV